MSEKRLESLLEQFESLSAALELARTDEQRRQVLARVRVVLVDVDRLVFLEELYLHAEHQDHRGSARRSRQQSRESGLDFNLDVTTLQIDLESELRLPPVSAAGLGNQPELADDLS